MSTSLSRRSSATAHPTRQQLDELDALLKRMLDLPVRRPEDEAESDPVAPAAASAPEPMRGPHRPAPVPERDEEPAVNYTTTDEADEEEADFKPRVVADASPAQKPDDWVPLKSTWQPSARTWKPLSDAWKQAQSAGRPVAEPPPAAPEPSLAVDSPPPSAPAVEPSEPNTPQAAGDSRGESPPITASEPAAQPPAEEPAWKTLPPLTVSPHRALWPLIAFNTVFDVCLVPWGAPGRWLRGRAGRMLLGAVGVACLAAAAALAVADWVGWTW